MSEGDTKKPKSSLFRALFSASESATYFRAPRFSVANVKAEKCPLCAVAQKGNNPTHARDREHALTNGSRLSILRGVRDEGTSLVVVSPNILASQGRRSCRPSPHVSQRPSAVPPGWWHKREQLQPLLLLLLLLLLRGGRQNPGMGSPSRCHSSGQRAPERSRDARILRVLARGLGLRVQVCGRRV